MDGHERRDEGSFDPEALKVLDTTQLIGALVEDAYDTALVHPEQTEDIQTRIMNVMWVFMDEEQAAIDERREQIDQVMGSLFSEIALFGGEEVDPDDAIEYTQRRQAARALSMIGRHRNELDAGLKDGHDEDFLPWSTGSTKYHLVKICEAQEEAGIALATDYVREVAMQEFAEQPGFRAIALLRNAFSGDAESYQLGIESLHEGISDDRIKWMEGSELLPILIRHIKAAAPEQRNALKDLAIEVLANIRGWRNYGFGSYASKYAEFAAELAVTLRDLSEPDSAVQ
jgi:hypothetical protein